MKYVSLFSGIEAATLAWEPLGWECVAFAEVAPFPSAVLAERWPGVPNLGDITQVDWSAYRGSVDLIVGGSPCQSFSVAGLRRGLDDPRGNLALEFLRAVDAVRPRWVVWENVPGVFSAVSHECPDPCPPPPPLDLGRDGAEVDTEDDYDAEEVHAFLTFLAALRQLGYGFSYRVLDAQYVRVESHPRAVPQRRRRVFVVGHSGELGRPGDEGEVQDAQRAWTLPAAVLVERESLSWHPAPRRAQGAGVAPTVAGGAGERGSRVDAETAAGGVCSLTANGVGTCGADDNQAQAGHLVPEVASSLQAQEGRGFCLNAETADGQLVPEVADPISASEGKTYSHEGAYNFRLHNVVSVAENQRGEIVTGDVSHAVSSGGGKPGSGYPRVAHALTSEGHDASEDGTGRDTPLVTAFQLNGDRDNPGVSTSDEAAFCLPANPMSDREQAVAYQRQGSNVGEDGTGRDTPLTLEVRGRDGERVLEWRDDGTANALRQPNGGRDGLGVGAVCMATGQANAEIVSEGSPSLTTSHDGPPICMAPSFSKRPGQQIATRDDGSSFAVTTGEPPRLAGAEMAVRRLTPRECERLQGMPDDHTLIEWKGKPAPDGKRYAAIGNSMAVNVMRFIGERIAVVEGLSI